MGTWARLLLLGLRLLLEAPSSAGDHWERLVEGCVGALDVLQDCCLGALLVHGHLQHTARIITVQHTAERHMKVRWNYATRLLLVLAQPGTVMVDFISLVP